MRRERARSPGRDAGRNAADPVHHTGRGVAHVHRTGRGVDPVHRTRNGVAHAHHTRSAVDPVPHTGGGVAHVHLTEGEVVPVHLTGGGAAPVHPREGPVGHILLTEGGVNHARHTGNGMGPVATRAMEERTAPLPRTAASPLRGKHTCSIAIWVSVEETDMLCTTVCDCSVHCPC